MERNRKLLSDAKLNENVREEVEKQTYTLRYLRGEGLRANFHTGRVGVVVQHVNVVVGLDADDRRHCVCEKTLKKLSG